MNRFLLAELPAFHCEISTWDRVILGVIVSGMFMGFIRGLYQGKEKP